MNLTTLKKQLSELPDNAGDWPYEDLQKLATSHDALLTAARNWFSEYRREYTEAEDDQIASDLEAAIKGAA